MRTAAIKISEAKLLRRALVVAQENVRLRDAELTGLIEKAGFLSEVVAYWQQQADEVRQMLHEEERRHGAA